MNRTGKITLCGITAALAAALMLASYFPYLTYAVPALSGLCMMLPVIEINCKWAFAAYLVSALPTLFFAEPEAKLLYIVLFGYYPVLKAVLDRLPRALGWFAKLAVLNAAVALVYCVLAPLIGIPTDEFGALGKYGAALLWASANGVFAVYDLAISRVSVFYMLRIHPKVRKYLRFSG